MKTHLPTLAGRFSVCCLLLVALLPRLVAGQPTAVVIGVSDFQDPGVHDLHYADRDARAFAALLQAPGGPQVNDDRLRLLTNEGATLAAIQAALQWQLETATPGGTTYLYLATHGDVEAEHIASGGFLLAHDTPSNNYELLALGIDYLDRHLLALAERNVRAVVITDACHAGALAGDAVAGRTLTAARLMQQRATEVRMLACQPAELSLEGKQWGGGRGAFSYYLEDGLRGAADQDGNLRIDLFELETYVKDRVAAETDRRQHPAVFGSQPREVLFTVAAERESALLVQRSAATVEDMAQAVLAAAPPDAQRDYVRFTRALQRGDLLSPAGESAAEQYARLRGQPALIALRGLLDEQLTVALLDSVQQALIAYLDADPNELRDRTRIDEKYAAFPRYLDAAAGILGERDPRYPAVRAKADYFRGVVLRLRAEQYDGADSSYQRALVYVDSALALQPEAAYLHNERGMLLGHLGDARAAYEAYARAVELAPTWALPHNNLGMLFKQRDPVRYYDQAAASFEQATALKPDLGSAYMNYGNLMYEAGRRDSAGILLRRALELLPTDVYARYNLAVWMKDDPARADSAHRMFRNIIRHDGKLLGDALRESARLYLHAGQPDSALQQLQRAIDRLPAPGECYDLLRRAHAERGSPALAEAYFAEMITTAPAGPEGYLHLALTDTSSNRWVRELRRAPVSDSIRREVATRLGFAFFGTGDYGHGEAALRIAAAGRQGHLNEKYNLTAFLAATGQPAKLLPAVRDLLQTATAAGEAEVYCERIAQDGDYRELLQTPAFREALAGHCPAPYPRE